MSSKKQKDTWRKTKRLQRYGVDADPTAVRVHSGETPKHVIARRLVGHVLSQANRAWDEEVETKHGRIDVVDYGSVDEAPLAVECETNLTESTKREKIEKYVPRGPCRDVIFLQLSDAPNEIDELAEWIEGELAGV